jgi:hypothetical protein
MSGSTKPPSKEGSTSATITATVPDPHAGPAGPQPPHIEIRTKKRRRKYSRGLKTTQRIERGVTKSTRRIARAISTGLGTYVERRDKSSRKRRDGAIRDGLKNWSKAVGKTMRKASNAPNDLTRAFDTKAVRRSVKFMARAIPLPFLR